MSVHRTAARKDTGSTAIVTALRAVGVKVWVLSGDGIPDLLTLYRGNWLPMELKNPGGEATLDKRNGRTYRTAPGKLTASQERFVAAARQGGAAVPVASSPAEAVAFVLAATRTNATQPKPSPSTAPVIGRQRLLKSNACPRCINVPPTPEG